MYKIIYFIWAMINLALGLFVVVLIASSINLIFETGDLIYIAFLPVFLLSLKRVESNCQDVKNAIEIISNIENGMF